MNIQVIAAKIEEQGN